MRTRIAVLGTAVGIAIGVAASRAFQWWRSWGIVAEETGRRLAGDDLIHEPVAIETRGITIDAPPSAVWPWLVQMGYGRAGWYSYDQLDQRGASTDRIVPEWQVLEVGDILPTHPGGGFEVVTVEPERSLVVRSDTALVRAQAEAATKGGGGLDEATTGVQLSGAILGSTPQDFTASWAFILEPIGDRQTRLIERFRVWYGEGSPGARFVMPFVGFGVFVMLQRQMTGIRARAESLAAAPDADPSPPDVPEALPIAS